MVRTETSKRQASGRKRPYLAALAKGFAAMPAILGVGLMGLTLAYFVMMAMDIAAPYLTMGIGMAGLVLLIPLFDGIASLLAPYAVDSRQAVTVPVEVAGAEDGTLPRHAA